MKKYKLITVLKVNSLKIQVHYSMPILIIIFLAMSLITNTPLSYFTGLLCIFLLTLVHELGHYFLIKRFGLITNSIVLLPILGYCDYYYSEYDYENYFIAWGGVFFQGILLIPSLLIFLLIPNIENQYLRNVILVLGPFNLITIIVNLLPMAFLDGARCWKSIPLFFKYGFIKFPNKKKSKKKKEHDTNFKNFKVVK